MSGWQAIERQRRVGFLRLTVRQNSLSGRWMPDVMLVDDEEWRRNGGGPWWHASLDASAFDDRSWRVATMREAEQLCDQAAKALGDVRPWMALFRYCGRFAGHVRTRPGWRFAAGRQPLLLGDGGAA
jgi:hypothetical protein